eukprot:SAG31_NODE_3093_length_4682_cov_47.973816_7_plen_120_part_00
MFNRATSILNPDKPLNLNLLVRIPEKGFPIVEQQTRIKILIFLKIVRLPAGSLLPGGGAWHTTKFSNTAWRVAVAAAARPIAAHRRHRAPPGMQLLIRAARPLQSLATYSTDRVNERGS